ncbi:MAG: DUF1573 domain-containing protein [Planctomycetaceae bacterium]|jgi:hypothetical protein|nr:DUF1573 domain-containing protein [Planctomycetaceae bacterium]
MKKYGSLIIGIVFTLMASLCAVFAVYERPVPSRFLIIDQSQQDIGTLRQKVTKDIVYHLTNTSSHIIELGNVNTSCGCTQWNLSTKTLKPKETSILTLTVDTLSARGTLGASAIVYYEIPEIKYSSAIMAEFIVHIVPDYEITPANFVFSSEKEKTQILTLTSTQEELVEIKEYQVSRDYFDFEILPFDKEKKTAQIQIKFLPEKWDGIDKGAQLTLVTSNSREPSYRVLLQVEPQQEKMP